MKTGASEQITVSKFLRLFRKFKRSERLKIAEKITNQTFEEQWSRLDKELPDAKLPEEEIMKEVRQVRYGRQKN